MLHQNHWQVDGWVRAVKYLTKIPPWTTHPLDNCLFVCHRESIYLGLFYLTWLFSTLDPKIIMAKWLSHKNWTGSPPKLQGPIKVSGEENHKISCTYVLDIGRVERVRLVASLALLSEILSVGSVYCSQNYYLLHSNINILWLLFHVCFEETHTLDVKLEGLAHVGRQHGEKGPVAVVLPQVHYQQRPHWPWSQDLSPGCHHNLQIYIVVIMLVVDKLFTHRTCKTTFIEFFIRYKFILAFVEARQTCVRI